ncbi:hypothetical protein BD410DRAFT_897515 [Rickenella mellea]|uniref:Uncharacterized protein n=1 Tax=Rickenella mellea TaxID=50990 RepID=A0A4Y7Q825_9AGAM|nr:hypothetical protein BD410DRAFT_897515 [Rickenella mellea]
MASWFDVVALLITAAVFGGTIYGVVYIAQQLSQTVKSTKETLKERGLHISDSGVSVKTNSRFNREDYIDATQRGLLKTMSASSFGTPDEAVKTPVLSRQDSAASTGSGKEKEEKEKKGFFRRKNSKQ